MSAAFKPTDLRAPGAVADLLAFHKARFGDARMEGEGGDGGGSGDGTEDKGGDKGSGAGATSSSDKEFDFPADTPLSEMTEKQRAEYWREKAQKHEARSKKFDGLTDEQFAALKDKATKHDAMERELMSDKDKAVAEARDAAKAEADAVYQPALVQAKFEALSAGRIDAERLAVLLDDIDLTKFLTDGKVDATKVAAKVDAWEPPQEEETQNRRRGPSPRGAGQRQSSSGPSLQSGAEIYASRKGRRG